MVNEMDLFTFHCVRGRSAFLLFRSQLDSRGHRRICFRFVYGITQAITANQAHNFE